MTANSYVTHLECSETGERHADDRLHGLSHAGKPLLVRYDLAAVAGAVTKRDLVDRPADMWRYRELLPLSAGDPVVSLGEAMTPLIRLPGPDARGGACFFKDEGRLPTGSFKARGMALAVTMAKRFGRTRIAVPTAGNAGAAAAAYGARAGLEVFVFAPEDTPAVTLHEIAYHGATLHQVDGLINRCAERLRERTAAMGWHDLSTLAEPYRIEGKKTMGLELAEQLDWTLPDVIYYPTGGGTGFIGMWKAFQELTAIGWLDVKLPRMVVVQTEGCHPIVDAHRRGLEAVPEPWADVRTEVHGVRVPKALGDFLILKVMQESGGHGVAPTDEDAHAARNALAREDGVAASLEGALCYAALQQDLAEGRVGPGEKVAIFNTGSCIL